MQLMYMKGKQEKFAKQDQEQVPVPENIFPKQTPLGFKFLIYWISENVDVFGRWLPFGGHYLFTSTIRWWMNASIWTEYWNQNSNLSLTDHKHFCVFFCRFSIYLKTQTNLQATLVMRVWGSALDSISDSWSIPARQLTSLQILLKQTGLFWGLLQKLIYISKVKTNIYAIFLVSLMHHTLGHCVKWI